MLALSQTTTTVEAEEIITTTERGGSAPSDIVDLFGPGHDQTLRYARIKLE